MSKKLLFVTTELNKGGAEVALINLLRHLNPNDFEVDVIITNHNPGSGISLISQIPDWVKICVISGQESDNFINRVKGKLFYRADNKEKYGVKVLEFIRDRHYDVAFSYGEWFDPDLIAQEVCADIKAVWIHTDISEAPYVKPDTFFRTFPLIDFYIFVSENAKNKGVEKFPFLKSKSFVIHNLLDEQEILKLSYEHVSDFAAVNEPYVITVANVRTEKNHLRAIETFFKLKQKGFNLKWLNVGAISDKYLFEELDKKLTQYDLKNEFIFIGSRENPYKYMKQAKAVVVPSDFESWSLVITEAKLLRIPVISTKTSGAVEQLIDSYNGVLADFNSEELAEKLYGLLTNPDLDKKIRNNLMSYSPTQKTLEEFVSFIDRGLQSIKVRANEKSLLFVMDNVNYKGGAHIAAKRVVNYLNNQNRNISIFSGESPDIHSLKELYNVKFLSWDLIDDNKLFNARILYVLLSKKYSFEHKKQKIKMTFHSKVYGAKRSFEKFVFPSLVDYFNQYNFICVTSEGSVYRSVVAATKKVSKKIQWIHTDYIGWATHNSWTQEITKLDGEIYDKFDKIIFVSEHSRVGFIQKFPSLNSKTIVMKNIIPIDQVKEGAIKTKKNKRIKLITVGRLEAEKGFDRILRVAKNMAEIGYDFVWSIVGDGEQKYYIKQLISDYNLENHVKLIGYRHNPFPLIADSDLFALLSHYEGLPNTIYESLILGTPVVATNVGGISEQIIHGETGWLIENNEEQIVKNLTYLFDNQEIISKLKSNLNEYNYNNKEIFVSLKNVFDI